MNRLLRLIILSGVIKVGGAGLTFLMFLYLARALGAEEYGRFATMFSLASFLGVAVLLGQHTRIIKRLAALLEVNAHGQARMLMRQGLWATVLASAGVSAGLALAGWVLTRLGRETGGAILIGAVPFVTAFALSELFASAFRGFGSVGRALVPRDILWRAAGVAMAVVPGVAVLQGADALRAMTLLSAVLLGLVAVQALLLLVRLPKELRAAKPAAPEIDFWTDSRWLWVASMIVIMGGHVSVVLTSLALGPAETGAFFAAAKVAQLLQLPIMAVNIVAAPILARLYVKGDRDAMQAACRSIAPFLLGSAVISAVVIGAAPVRLLSLFDPAFTGAAPALIVLAAGQLFSVLCGPCGLLMLMTRGERRLVAFVGISEGIGLVSILVLAPQFGVLGAAVAGLVGKIGWNVLTVLWCRRALDLDPTVLSLVRE